MRLDGPWHTSYTMGIGIGIRVPKKLLLLPSCTTGNGGCGVSWGLAGTTDTVRVTAQQAWTWGWTVVA